MKRKNKLNEAWVVLRMQPMSNPHAYPFEVVFSHEDAIARVAWWRRQCPEEYFSISRVDVLDSVRKDPPQSRYDKAQP